MHVIEKSRRQRARDYVFTLAAAGRYHFVSHEARAALGVSSDATKLALNRLARQTLIASPARGFYVIVPPEYRSLGCLPAEQFVPALMERLRIHYYAGLLSAAQYHGAAHQRPQEFQVFLGMHRRPIRCGRVRVAFIMRKRAADVSVQGFNTPRGRILVSTPEATALDLVGYAQRVGGLGQVATVLSELAERINPEKLAAAARTGPLARAQRLGYLLEHIVGARDKVEILRIHVQEQVRQCVALVPSGPRQHAARDKKWKLYVNAKVEAEL